jgi:hypothetical protein
MVEVKDDKLKTERLEQDGHEACGYLSPAREMPQLPTYGLFEFPVDEQGTLGGAIVGERCVW